LYLTDNKPFWPFLIHSFATGTRAALLSLRLSYTLNLELLERFELLVVAEA
jgi:hypothetical protein